MQYIYPLFYPRNQKQPKRRLYWTVGPLTTSLTKEWQMTGTGDEMTQQAKNHQKCWWYRQPRRNTHQVHRPESILQKNHRGTVILHHQPRWRLGYFWIPLATDIQARDWLGEHLTNKRTHQGKNDNPGATWMGINIKDCAKCLKNLKGVPAEGKKINSFNDWENEHCAATTCSTLIAKKCGLIHKAHYN